MCWTAQLYTQFYCSPHCRGLTRPAVNSVSIFHVSGVLDILNDLAVTAWLFMVYVVMNSISQYLYDLTRRFKFVMYLKYPASQSQSLPCVAQGQAPYYYFSVSSCRVHLWTSQVFRFDLLDFFFAYTLQSSVKQRRHFKSYDLCQHNANRKQNTCTAKFYILRL